MTKPVLTQAEKEALISRHVQTEQGKNQLRRAMGFVRWYERLFGYDTYIERSLRMPSLLSGIGVPEAILRRLRATFEKLAAAWWRVVHFVRN